MRCHPYTHRANRMKNFMTRRVGNFVRWRCRYQQKYRPILECKSAQAKTACILYSSENTPVLRCLWEVK
jgi:hypothetical protein